MKTITVLAISIILCVPTCGTSADEQPNAMLSAVDDRFIADSRTYAGRFLRLTSLSPDIVEAVLPGNEPEGISLAKLRNNPPAEHW